MASNEFMIFPTIFSKETNIYSSKDLHGVEICVTDCQGKILRKENCPEGNNFILDCTNIPAGMYFISIARDGQTMTGEKIIVVR